MAPQDKYKQVPSNQATKALILAPLFKHQRALSNHARTCDTMQSTRTHTDASADRHRIHMKVQQLHMVHG